jgi:hypothetical protein
MQINVLATGYWHWSGETGALQSPRDDGALNAAQRALVAPRLHGRAAERPRPDSRPATAGAAVLPTPDALRPCAAALPMPRKPSACR